MNKHSSPFSLESARKRAEIISRIRQFFHDRDVLEVETPALVRGNGADYHLDPFITEFHPSGWKHGAGSETAYLHTSPELAMKRLLAAGFGDLFQICKVYRNGECGRIHNPEFTMLEWYRLNFSMDHMIDETVALMTAILGNRPVHKNRYDTLVSDATGFNALATGADELHRFCRSRDLNPPLFATVIDGLQFVMSQIIEPGFDPHAITVVTHFPADQALFARLDPEDARFSLRFEAYCGHMELANGFEELADWKQNEQRMVRENEKRRRAGKGELVLDQEFVAALKKSLPPCSGNALGLDRLIMLALGKRSINEVMAFGWNENQAI
ncbi:MAG: EF-P lysine aminoacylase GenX [Chitinispirillaceae bacterium]|nr:EF-P lysine aminoacylase GenX [Chitinispirillaceae bacterium]